MSDLGYVSYLGFIFLPGIGLGELLHLWQDGDSFAARLAYSFGLGLAVDTTVIAVRTSGLSSALTGLDSWTVYGVIAFGVAAILISVSLSRRLTWYVKPRLEDFAVLAILLAQGGVILIYLQKYPIFPEYQSPDFSAHVQIAQSLINGSAHSVPAGVLYYGIHFQLASSLVLVGGVPLVTVRWTMAILAILSPLLFYLVAQRLSSSKAAAAIAAIVYSFSGTIWFGSVFNSGLYANFFGILIALFLIVVLLDFGSNKSFGTWVVLGFAIIVTYFSHYSTITMLPAILVLAPMEYVINQSLPKRLLFGCMLVMVPAAAGLLIDLGAIGHLLYLATEGGG
ncbi:MAG TPA: hypothetical protein VEC08_02315, partial [Nitrososphaerales archaeon]|nr:hypothetical protein [Nitrososphaerales archaeon]